MPEIHKGLEEVYVDRSSISRVFGGEGKLTYRGYWIEDLAERASYEEVVYLLLNGELPTEAELEEFAATMASDRDLPTPTERLLKEMADTAPMDVLRTAVSSLSDGYDPDAFSMEENRERGLRIISAVPTIVAHFDRLRRGKQPVEPDSDLSHAANFYYMLHDERPSEAEADAVDTALVLYAEHGMNASTFASVVTASTQANIYSAITSGSGALQGPLHGGATETVVEMLDEVGTVANVDDYVDRKMAAGEVIPGFGHRVYKAVDPRCKEFSRIYHNIAGEEGEAERLELVDALRDRVVEELGEKGVYPNADLYSGTVYNALGIARDLYTCMFAMARVAGWTAHVLEQWGDNRIVRPRAEYTGDLDREFVPLEER